MTQIQNQAAMTAMGIKNISKSPDEALLGNGERILTKYTDIKKKKMTIL